MKCFLTLTLRHQWLLLAGVIGCLAALRIIEYVVDVRFGNGDGYLTTPAPAFWLTLVYAFGYLAAFLLLIRAFRLAQKSPWVHILIVMLLCVGMWLIFYPANMSPDSLVQYEQARTGRYHDWHPPIMALILAGIMRGGGDLGFLMFGQCLLGGSGIYVLARAVLEVSPISRQTASCLALLVFCLLLSPLSPLAVYLTIFWKDAWCAIALLWLFALAFRLYRKAPRASRASFYTGMAGFLLLTVLTLLTRHNAIVMLPFLMGLAGIILYLRRRIGFWQTAMLSLMLGVGYLGVQTGQYLLFPIERRHPEQQVLLLDLVGMIVQQPALRSELPYISQHLTADYAAVYIYGDSAALYDAALSAPPSDRQAIIREYRHAVRHAPFTWLVVKWRAFYELIRPSRIHYWFIMGIPENSFGLRQNAVLQSVRNGLRIRMLAVWNSPLLRMLCGVHLVWIGVTLGGIGWSLRRYARMRQPRDLFGSILLMTILAYYGSYLLAATAWDFRLMYPATLAMQVISLAGLFMTRIGIRRRPVDMRSREAMD